MLGMKNAFLCKNYNTLIIYIQAKNIADKYDLPAINKFKFTNRPFFALLRAEYQHSAQEFVRDDRGRR